MAVPGGSNRLSKRQDERRHLLRITSRAAALSVAGLIFLTRSAPAAESFDADTPITLTDSSETGRYKAKLYRGVRARWHLYVQQEKDALMAGKVRIEFYIHADGSISDLEVKEGKGFLKLSAISRRAILEASGGLAPFSEEMKRKWGEGFCDDLTFRIEDQPELSPEWANKWKM